MNLTELSKIVNAANHKWWVDLETGEPIKRDKSELIALIHSEVSEALEGARKDKMDDHLPHRKMEEVEIVDAIIRLLDYCGGFGYEPHIDDFESLNELRDLCWDSPRAYNCKGDLLCSIHYETSYLWYVESKGLSAIGTIEELFKRLFTYAGEFNLDVDGAFHEKMAYNAIRADHTLEERRKEGGKKF